MRRSRFSWGGFLILLGILFLLSNSGIVSVNFWRVLWPLILIWIGLQKLWETREEQRTVKVAEAALPIKGVEEAHIYIEYGRGSLNIHGNTAPDELLSGTFVNGLDHDSHKDGDTLTLILRPPSGRFAANHYRDWTFGLNEAIPLTLNINTEASEANLDLENLTLAKLHLKSGTGEANITLPANAGYTKVKVETGAAPAHIRVPENVAARMNANGRLPDMKIDQKRFPRRGDMYESADYSTANNKVEIEIDKDASKIVIW